MVVKVGINGFGRIGRLAFRRIQNVEGVEAYSHQRPYRSSYACTLVEIRHNSRSFSMVLQKLKKVDSKLTVKFVKVSAERDPEQIDWAT